jgi:RNA polymerase sigma factor (sigma-70 family)
MPVGVTRADPLLPPVIERRRGRHNSDGAWARFSSAARPALDESPSAAEVVGRKRSYSAAETFLCVFNADRQIRGEPMDDDATLLRRFVEERSEPDFRAFVERRFNFVYAAAMRSVGGDAHLAQEVAQNVFIDAARKARGLAARPSLLGWLCVSTRFAAAAVLRARSRRAKHEQNAAMNEVRGPEIAWDELRPIIDQALAELPEYDREAILLRFFEDQNYAGVAAGLGLGENAARMRVERALEKLRGRLARRGITSTGAALGLVLASQPAVAAPTGMATIVASTSLAAVATSGALGTTGLLRLIHFMNTGKLAIATVGLCLAVGLGDYWGSRRPASALVAANAAQLDSLHATVADLTRENGRLKAELTSRSASRREVTGKASNGGDNANSPSTTLVPGSLEVLKLLADLQQKKLLQPSLMFLDRLGKVDGSFAQLFALTPDEQDRMQQLVDATRGKLAALEQANAKITRDRKGDIVISVHPFPAEGGKVYDATMSGIGEILGPERNDAFQKIAAPQVETMLGKFGAADRTYTFGYNETSPTPYTIQDKIVQDTPGNHDDYITTRQFPTYDQLAASIGPIVNALPSDYKRSK